MSKRWPGTSLLRVNVHLVYALAPALTMLCLNSLTNHTSGSRLHCTMRAITRTATSCSVPCVCIEPSELYRSKKNGQIKQLLLYAYHAPLPQPSFLRGLVQLLPRCRVLFGSNDTSRRNAIAHRTGPPSLLFSSCFLTIVWVINRKFVIVHLVAWLSDHAVVTSNVFVSSMPSI